MVKWGFEYDSISNMPLDEYYDFLELMNKHNDEERKASSGGGSDQAPVRQEAKPIGSVAPQQR